MYLGAGTAGQHGGRNAPYLSPGTGQPSRSDVSEKTIGAKARMGAAAGVVRLAPRTPACRVLERSVCGSRTRLFRHGFFAPVARKAAHDLAGKRLMFSAENGQGSGQNPPKFLTGNQLRKSLQMRRFTVTFRSEANAFCPSGKGTETRGDRPPEANAERHRPRPLPPRFCPAIPGDIRADCRPPPPV